MGVLEQITSMKEKGVSEEEIVKNLRNQGVSPNEISEAMSQSKIKSAVSSEQESNSQEGMEPSMMPPQKQESKDWDHLPTENISDEDLTPPPKPQNLEQLPSQKKYKQMTREFSEDQEESQDYIPKPESSFQEQYSPPTQEYQPSYSEDYNTDYYNESNTDTMIEISEQVFSEKIKNIQRQVDEFNEFKNISEVRIEDISNRLKRIETSIDRLQVDILEKIGSYGRGIENINKEMGMMQETFGKVVNNLADKSEKKHSTKKSRSVKKNSKK